MFHRYQHEEQYYPTLSRLPLDVRRKLDIIGVKTSLNDWLACSLEERAVLCHLPCENAEERDVFLRYLDSLSRRYGGKPVERIAAADAGLWGTQAVPDEVFEKSAALNCRVSINEWCAWPEHARYALYKTATSKSQPEAFEQVLSDLRQR